MRSAALRKIIFFLAMFGPVLTAAGQPIESLDGTSLQREIVSGTRAGVDGLAALPDVLVVRQGTAVYGLDPFSLQQLWFFQGKEPAAEPLVLGTRLFLFDSEVRVSTSSSGGWGGGGATKTTKTTDYRVVELDPATGHLRWERETDLTPPRVLSACRRAAFLFREGDLGRPKFTLFLATGESPPSRVYLARRLGKDLAHAIGFERIWLSGSHLLAWVPELRLIITVPLVSESQPWRRPFDAEVVDATGCGSREVVVTTSEGLLVGLDALTGKTLWKVTRPVDQTALIIPTGQSVAMPAEPRLAELDSKDGSIRSLPLKPPLGGARGLLQDGHGRSVLFTGSRLSSYDFASGAQEWEYDAGEPIVRMAAAEGYVALVTESGKVEVLGQTRPRSAVAGPIPAAGVLELTVDPDDAYVWLDGSFLGVGGRRIENLAPGQHELRMVHPDRKRQEDQVTITAGQITKLTLIMPSRSQGPVRIDSTPGAASVSIDGKPAGTTPLPPRSGIPAGQVLDVVLRKQGYQDVRRQLTIREDGGELSAKLELAPLLGGIFVGGRRVASGPIHGWRWDDIRVGQVVGDPFRPSEGNSFLSGAAFVELGPRRWRLFGRYADTIVEETSEWEAGLWLSLGSSQRVEVGASFLNLEAAGGDSKPPCETTENQRGCTDNRSAPLEKWHHPIPEVFVRNESPSYWIGRVRFRLEAGIFLDLGIGRLREEARLQGTALVEDGNGHLIRDEARSYDFRAHSSTFLETRLQVALGTFRIWKLFPSTAMEIHYRHRRTDFGVVDETTSELTFGVGILGFRSKPWAAL